MTYDRAKVTPGPWRLAKCPCGDPVCDQWRFSHQGSQGLARDDAHFAVQTINDELQATRPSRAAMRRIAVDVTAEEERAFLEMAKRRGMGRREAARLAIVEWTLVSEEQQAEASAS